MHVPRLRPTSILVQMPPHHLLGQGPRPNRSGRRNPFLPRPPPPPHHRLGQQTPRHRLLANPPPDIDRGTRANPHALEKPSKTEPHQKRTGKTGERKTGLASNADVAATATATATATASKVVACPRSRRVESNRHTFRRWVAPRAWAQSDVRETATISSRGTTLMRTRPSGSPSAFSCSSSRCQPPRSVYSTPRS